jgi:hypothetical protein
MSYDLKGFQQFKIGTIAKDILDVRSVYIVTSGFVSGMVSGNSNIVQWQQFKKPDNC